MQEGVVGTSGGFEQMLESTYIATRSSFFAMVSVAEQFRNLHGGTTSASATDCGHPKLAQEPETGHEHVPQTPSNSCNRRRERFIQGVLGFSLYNPDSGRGWPVPSEYKSTVTRKTLLAEEAIAAHENALKFHEESLQDLHSNHARDIESIRASSKADYDSQVNILTSEHAENIKLLESDASEARDEIKKVATQVAFAIGLDVSVEKISEHIGDLVADQKALLVRLSLPLLVLLRLLAMRALNQSRLRLEKPATASGVVGSIDLRPTTDQRTRCRDTPRASGEDSMMNTPLALFPMATIEVDDPDWGTTPLHPNTRNVASGGDE
ncbi:Uu.00g032380.m01.CDS01 [Anthostomella pinea]|uniref:Uu.00g032380.m01.CDS01 n=1 Tax=Anthostomella pinea TaxID=933095 RepID=A0AAI8YD52_9PEZI|nr:Uu.00g032380.m01.CDS01 [Anthostomella pinea]